MTTEIIPLCLRIMESGSELSKTVATFILQKILLDDSGLSYICQTYDRFSHVAMILVSYFSIFDQIFSLLFTFINLLGQDGTFFGQGTIGTFIETCGALLFETFWQSQVNK